MKDFAKIDTSHDNDMDTQKLLTFVLIIISAVSFLLIGAFYGY